MEQIQALANDIMGMRKRMQDEGKSALRAAFKEFFEKYPNAKSISWKQYTPYFNDGDACTFRVGDLGLKMRPEGIAGDLREYVVQGDEDDDYDGGPYICAFKYLDPKYTYCPDALQPLKDAGRVATADEKAIVDDFNALSAAVQSISEVLQMVFDDHVTVTVDRRGFHTEEYDHE